MATYFAFVEHVTAIPCAECGANKMARVPNSLSYIVDAQGSVREFESSTGLGPNTLLTVRCPRAHLVRFKADGTTQVFRTQANSPMPGNVGNTATIEY